MKGEPSRAQLLDDSGRAAETDEFFRSRPFYDAEGVTHTLHLESAVAEAWFPIIVNPIDEGPQRDAISPYGFPGSTVGSGPPFDHAAIDFSETGLVTAFLRHTLGPPPLTGTTERNTVQIADLSKPLKLRPSDRRQISRNAERGYKVKIAHGPESSPRQRGAFHTLYLETMRRNEAKDRYRYEPWYFDTILKSPLAWLAIAYAPNEAIAAGSVVVRSDGFLHYYLSGTADAYLQDSPMKNIVSLLIKISRSTDLPLNLGGGKSKGDRLEAFKRGFANTEQALHTSELVCDSATYRSLTAGKDANGFFPGYRA